MHWRTCDPELVYEEELRANYVGPVGGGQDDDDYADR